MAQAVGQGLALSGMELESKILNLNLVSKVVMKVYIWSA